MEPAPLATTAEAVAAATVKALRAGRRIVWVPPALRPLMAVARHLPAAPVEAGAPLTIGVLGVIGVPRGGQGDA